MTIANQYKTYGAVTWGTYHYCQKPYVSWYQFAQVIVRHAIDLGLVDHPVEVVPIPSSKFPTPVKRPVNSKLDTEKYRTKFSVDIASWDKDLEELLNNFIGKDNTSVLR